MRNKKTPLLQNLRETGGTLYVFPSAYEDIGLNLQSTTTGVAMSHYALLNIPALSMENVYTPQTSTISSMNEALALSLQDYAMNFETFLTNREEYNYQELSTVSERVFWHWMQHIGALDSNNLVELPLEDTDNTIKVYYENQNSETVVKCVGSIDAGNSLSTEFGIYNETYINIPTSYGSSKYFFENIEDSNYNSQDSYKITEGYNKLQGRNDNNKYYSYHPGEDIPVYDSDSTIEYYYDVKPEKDCLSLAKNISNIKKYYDKFFNNEFVISSFDDINIDIDDNFGVKDEFEFNAILLYYSVYDQDDLVKTSYATNLFGVIFIDGAKSIPSTDEGYIPTLTKRKSRDTHFGNSYSFRVNIKTQSVYDNTDAVIQDNTTTNSILSVDLSDVISQMNVAIDTLNTNTQVIAGIQNKYAAILSRYDDLSNDINEIKLTLNQYMKGAQSNKLSTRNLHVQKIIKDDAVDQLEIHNSANSVSPSMVVDTSVYVPNINVNEINIVNTIVDNDNRVPATFDDVSAYLSNISVNFTQDSKEIYLVDDQGNIITNYMSLIPYILRYIKQ